MRSLAFILLLLTAALPVQADSHARACQAAPDNLVFDGYQKISTLEDGGGFRQQVHRGAGAALSIVDFTARDRAGRDRSRVVESLARQLRTTSGDGGVQQVNPDRVTAFGFDLIAFLYVASDSAGLTRIEAGSVAFREGCYTVLRHSAAGQAGRNALLDAYLALISDWHGQITRRQSEPVATD